MIKNQLVDYITYTPHNFNKAVFNSIFNSYVNNINQFYQKSNLEKIDDYLYYIKYDDIDYSAGVDYSKRFKMPLGGCSSVYTNGLLGRNYDWYYDNSVTFVVRTSANESRHASIGVATIASLEKDFVEDGTWDDMYAVLPSMMLDGINDAGVMCNINVVPGGDLGFTTGTHPGKEKLCGLSLVRFVLDNAESVENAIELLKKKDIWMPDHQKFMYEVHLMIADGEKSIVVEFVNNEMVFIEDAKAMTNFYLYGVEFNEDGSVYTPATQTETENAIVTNHITPYGAGLERYNILIDGIEDVIDAEDMTDLMTEIYYTKAFVETPDEDSWYTESVGGNLNVASATEDFLPIMAIEYQMFVNRDRNKKDTWQTVHSCVFDSENLAMYIRSQEGEEAETFCVEEIE